MIITFLYIIIFGIKSKYMIFFGILHLLGVSVILAYLLAGTNRIILGIMIPVIVVLGIKFYNMRTNNLYLIWAGIRKYKQGMCDYYPIFPYFASALLGVIFGRSFYPEGNRQNFPDLSEKFPIKFLSTMGRYSLLIYLVHQPLLMGVFEIIKAFRS